MTVLAFDFGIKHIGVAVGQNITKTAQCLSSIKVKNEKINLHTFKTLFYTWKPYYIIIGFPLNMNGTRQNITTKSEMFAKKLFKHFNIPYYLYDERLTTIEAKTILFERYGFKSLIKTTIDSTSAVIILESWFKNNMSIFNN
ncbi:Holliday junction resolvase RuvX [Buchnera aphidicola]|uniref:Putative pre-16S rRNA nuclease n=1 Tax=Buchnera aphidicola subsp. Melaphis rhois TaxID=118103 RepID=A0A4D6Y4J2_BUCMH|nr:Holliday junction resolvase RuvX [Buchnera aphidicola]QCI23503.1 Holliday junction resolvase RuvX [Buchnera aphidicola (Melaphis rhois)]